MMDSTIDDQPKTTKDHVLEVESPPEDTQHVQPRDLQGRLSRHSSSSRVHPCTVLPRTSTTRYQSRIKRSCNCSPQVACWLCFCCLLALLFIFLFFIYPILAFIYGSTDPSFQVNSVSMTSSNKTNNPISSYTWDGNISIKNQNKLEVLFERIEVYVFNKDRFVSLALIESFYVKGQKEKTIQAHLETSTLEQPFVKKDSSGDYWEVNFNMKLAVWATYAPGSTWEWDLRMDVFCEDLTVEFAADTGVGKSSAPGPRSCPIHENYQ